MATLCEPLFDWTIVMSFLSCVSGLLIDGCNYTTPALFFPGFLSGLVVKHFAQNSLVCMPSVHHSEAPHFGQAISWDFSSSARSFSNCARRRSSRCLAICRAYPSDWKYLPQISHFFFLTPISPFGFRGKEPIYIILLSVSFHSFILSAKTSSVQSRVKSIWLIMPSILYLRS